MGCRVTPGSRCRASPGANHNPGPPALRHAVRGLVFLWVPVCVRACISVVACLCEGMYFRDGMFVWGLVFSWGCVRGVVLTRLHGVGILE